jgi:general secretion pathway protein G
LNTNLIVKRHAFTMIELVFVIVVIGILAAIAIPKFAATRDDAQIAKGRSDVAAIRSAIVSERQTRLLRGDSIYINKLHSSTTSLFDGNGSSTLLQYGIALGSSNGHWNSPTTISATSPNAQYTYVYTVAGKNVLFTYTQSNGTFDCNRTNTTYGAMCKLLVD